MEITTYIENHTPIDLPPFKHPTRVIVFLAKKILPSLIKSSYLRIKHLLNLKNLSNATYCSVHDIIMEGYKLQLKDWEMVKKLYPGIRIRIKLFRGNQVTQVSDSVI